MKLTKNYDLIGISSTLKNGYSFIILKGKKEK